MVLWILTLSNRDDRFVLDLASIKGGAPARTRGLDIYAVEPALNGFIGTQMQS